MNPEDLEKIDADNITWFKCFYCEGKGGLIDNKYPSYYKNDPSWIRCPKCFGEGWLDWTENARGGKAPIVSY